MEFHHSDKQILVNQPDILIVVKKRKSPLLADTYQNTSNTSIEVQNTKYSKWRMKIVKSLSPEESLL